MEEKVKLVNVFDDEPVAANQGIAAGSRIDNPDSFAENLKVSDSTGLPIDVVERNKEEVQRKLKPELNAFDFPEESHEWLSDPNNAALVHDVPDTVWRLKQALGIPEKVGRSLYSGAISTSAGFYGALQTGSALVEEYVQNPVNKFLGIPLIQGFDTATDWFAELRKGVVATQEAQRAKVGATGLVERSIYSGVESIGNSLPSVMLSVATGNPAPVLGTAAITQGGQSAGEALDKGRDSLTALLYGVSDASIEVATEMLPISKLIGDTKVGAPLFKTLIHQFATDVPGELAATTLQDLNEWAVLNPDKPFSAYLKQLPEDLAQTLIATMTAVGVQTGVVHGINRSFRNFGETEKAAEVVQGINQTVKEDVLYQRSQQRFNDLVGQLAGDDKIYIGGQALSEVLAAIPEQQRAVILEKVPDIKFELKTAAEIGSDVAISKADYASYIAPLENSDLLADHVKLDPADMSVAERQDYQDFIAQNPEIVQELQNPPAVPQEDFAAIERVVAKAMKAAGRSNEEAKANAPLFARTIARFTSPLGLNAASEMNKGLLQFQTVNAEGQAIKSGSNFDVLITDLEKIRAGQKVQGLDEQGQAAVLDFGSRLDAAGIPLAEAKALGGRQVFERLYPVQEDGSTVVPEEAQPVIDTLERIYQPQEQVLSQPERGFITLGRDFQGNLRNVIISFTESANFSTAAHEFAHFAVAMHRQFAELAKTADQSNPEVRRIVEDWDALKKQVGATSDKFTTEQEELVARQFEAYLREGNAPSEGLRRVFARFRDWLVKIYRDLKELGAPLNDEVRGIFDRWLAASDEIEAVKNKNASIEQIAKNLGLDANVTNQIADYINTASSQAEETLYKELSREQKKRETEAYRREFKTMREKVSEEVRQQKNYGLVDYLETNGFRVFIDPDTSQYALGNLPEDVNELPPDFTAQVEPGELKQLQEEAASNEAIREAVINTLLAPPPKKPMSLTSFLVSKGGVTDVYRETTKGLIGGVQGEGKSSGDLNAIGATSKTRPGLINNKKGLELDAARELAVEAGYLPEDASINDFLEALSDDVNGRRDVFSSSDYDATAALQEYAEADELANRMGIDIEFERKRRMKYGRYANLFTDDKNHEKAASADQLAELFGYPSGVELVKELRATPDFDRVVNREARQRLLDKYPDMITGKQIHNRAVDAVLNDRVVLGLDLLIKELSRQHGSKVSMKQFAKVMAQQKVSSLRASDSGYAYRYEAARSKELHEALKASRAGNPTEAMLHLQKALLNQAMFKQLEAFNELKAKAQQLFKDVDDKDKNLAKTRDIDFIGAARYILNKYGLGGESFDINSWVQDIQEKNPDVMTDLVGLAKMISAPQKKAKELTIAEYSDIYNSVKNIVWISRQMKEFQIADRKFKTEQAVGEIVEVLGKLKQRPKLEGTQVYGKAKIRENLMGFKAMARRVEHWVDSVQGGYDGPLRKYVYQIISDASSAYRDARHSWLERLNGMLEQHKDYLSQGGKINVPEIARTFRDRLELIGFLLHTGNTSNLEKLLTGYAITPEQWAKAFDRLQVDGIITKRDMEIVQELWDMAEDLKPIAQKAHKALYGYRFEEIEAAPITTAFGVFRGGYWPATVDYDQVKDRITDETLEDFKRYSLPGTSKGFTKSRNTAYRKPLSTDLRIASVHLNQVLKFAYLEPAVRQVSRIVNHNDFKEALNAVDSEAKISMLDPWLRRSAWQVVSSLTTDNSAFNRFFNGAVFRFLNKTVSRQAMMGNIANAIQNYTAIPVAMHKVGARRFAHTFAQYIQNPFRAADEVRQMSAYMRGRQNVNDILVSQQINSLIFRHNVYKKITDYADRYGYVFQRISQGHVDTLTWMAGFNQALEEGKSEADAVKYADSVVRTTMSSMNPEDVSDIEAGSEAAKLFLKFYGWFNNLANYAGTNAAVIIREAGWKGAPQLFWLYLMAILAPANLGDIVMQAIRGTPPADDDDDGEVLDDWLAWSVNSQARFVSASIPFAGQLINALILTQDDKPYNDEISVAPVFQQTNQTIRFLGKEIKGIRTGDGYDDKSNELRDGLRALGFVTGLPLGQLSKPVSFVADVKEGESRPKNVVEYSRGLIGGPVVPSP